MSESTQLWFDLHEEARNQERRENNRRTTLHGTGPIVYGETEVNDLREFVFGFDVDGETVY